MLILESFKEELAYIKRAPMTFIIGFIVLAVIMWFAQYQFIVKERISHNDSIIKEKDDLIKTLQDKLAVSKTYPDGKKSGATGSVRVSGTGNIGNSGNNSSFEAEGNQKNK